MNKNLQKVLAISTLAASMAACTSGGGGSNNAPTNLATQLFAYNNIPQTPGLTGTSASFSSNMFSALTGNGTLRTAYLARGTNNTNPSPAASPAAGPIIAASGFTQFDIPTTLIPGAATPFPAALALSGVSATTLDNAIATITATTGTAPLTGNVFPIVASTLTSTVAGTLNVGTWCTTGSFEAFAGVAAYASPIFTIGTTSGSCNGLAAIATTSDLFTAPLGTTDTPKAQGIATCTPSTITSADGVTNISGTNNSFAGVGTADGNVCIWGPTTNSVGNQGWTRITTGGPGQTSAYQPGSQGAVTAVQLVSGSATTNNGYFQTAANGQIWKIVANSLNVPQSIANLSTTVANFPGIANIAVGTMFVDAYNTVFIGGSAASAGVLGTKVYSLKSGASSWGVTILPAAKFPVVSITQALNGQVTAGVLNPATGNVGSSYLVTAP